LVNINKQTLTVANQHWNRGFFFFIVTAVWPH